MTWNELPSFSLIEGARQSTFDLFFSRDFETVLAEVRGGAYFDESMMGLIGALETRDQLEQVVSSVSQSTAVVREQVVDRLHDALLARCRTPRATLSNDEALALATDHMGQVAAIFEMLTLPRDEMFEGLLRRVVSLPLIVSDDPDSSHKAAIPFPHGLICPIGSGEVEYPFTEHEALNFSSVVGDLAIPRGQSINAPRSDPDAFSWSSLWWALQSIFQAEDYLAQHVLRPVVERVINPDFYYRLWAGGASLWVTHEAIEVRTYTAERWTSANYRG